MRAMKNATLPKATEEVAMSSTKLSLLRPGAAKLMGLVPSIGCGLKNLQHCFV